MRTQGVHRVSPDAAFCLYYPDISAWKLLLAEVNVRHTGPREVYREVQKTLNGLRNQIAHLSLEDIAVTSPDDPIIKLLSMVVTTGPRLEGFRLTHNVINGTLIEDAFIYRLKRPAV
jgi:hypothetical protein